MKESVFEEIVQDTRVARKFKNKTLGFLRNRKTSRLEKLAENLNKIKEDYGFQDGKDFFLKLIDEKRPWYYYSNMLYNYYLSFEKINDNKIKVQSFREYILNVVYT